MLILAIVLVLLAVLAFFPVLLVSLSAYSGSFFVRLEAFLMDYSSSIISLGTLALISGLALLTTYLSNLSSERREIAAQRVQIELQIAGFRQDWIGDFREDLSQYGKILLNEKPDSEASYQRLYLEMKLHMRLNPDEDLAKDLKDAMSDLRSAGREKDMEKKRSSYRNFVLAGNAFLRNEWKRLIADVENARLLEDVS